MSRLTLPENLRVHRYNEKLQKEMEGKLFIHGPGRTEHNLDKIVKVKYVYANNTVKVQPIGTDDFIVVPLKTLQNF